MSRLLMILLAASAAAAAQRQTQLQPLQIELAPDRSSYILGEPVVVNVTIRHSGPGSRVLPARLEPDYGAIDFYTRRDGQAWQRFKPWALIENDASQTLAPNTPLVVPARIFFGADGWTFASTGTYEVYARFGESRSADARVVVADAVTDAERALSRRLVRNDQAGRFLLLDGGDHLDDAMPLMNELAASNTRLGAYAANALGLNAMTPFVNFRTGQRREANFGRALELLQRSRPFLPEGHFRLENYQGLDKAFRAMGRAQEAIQLQQQYRLEIQQANLPPAIRAHAQQIIRR